MWVNACTERNGLVVLEPVVKAYHMHAIAVANSVLMANLNRPFLILVPNFGDTSMQL